MMGCMTFNDRQNIRPFYAEAESYPGMAKKQISYGRSNINFTPKAYVLMPSQRYFFYSEYNGRMSSVYH